MVILNSAISVDYNKMKNIILKESNENIMKILNDLFFNNENKDEYIKYILKNNHEKLKEIMNSNYNIYLFINNNYCVHKYKRGKREGHICGAKIEIESDDYLCSRHNRKYESKQRIYSMENPRCSYIRNNNQQCKHKCKKNNNYCYIHFKNEKYEIKNNNRKYDKINKLKYLRSIYYINKCNKNKYKYDKNNYKKIRLCEHNNYNIYKKHFKKIEICEDITFIENELNKYKTHDIG